MKETPTYTLSLSLLHTHKKKTHSHTVHSHTYTSSSTLLYKVCGLRFDQISTGSVTDIVPLLNSSIFLAQMPADTREATPVHSIQ